MKILTLALVLGLATTVVAQQLEVNSAGGSLTNAGTNPTVGVPFNVFVGNNFNVRVGGGANLPLILLYSSFPLANPSNDFGGVFGGQYLDLDQNGLLILVDAIGNTGAVPSAFGFTNGAGQANYSLPTSAAILNTVHNFQGIVFDVSQPFNLNFTAAGSYSINSIVTFTGDETFNVYTLPQGPMNICGTNRSQITVSTNGWVTFSAETTADFSETVGEFVTANPGSTTVFSGAPMIAVMWEDLNMIATSTPAGLVTVDNPAPGQINVTWANGSYFTSPTGIWGTNTLSITDIGSGTIQAVADYTGFTFATPPNEGIVGFSSGIAGATTTNTDVSTAGAINPFASLPGANNYFQTFDGVNGAFPGPAAGPFDLGGQVMTYLIASDCSLVVF